MENSVKLKVMNGLTSALLIAPAVAPAANALAQGSDDSASETGVTTVYENDFSEEAYTSDEIMKASGNAQLIWTDDLEVEGNENGSGVWVTNRASNYDGIDLPFDQIGIEEGLEYSIEVMGYIAEDESVPDDTAMNLETDGGYHWIHSLSDVSAGETFKLEGTYTAYEKEGDIGFRIKTNNDSAMEFAVTNISITAEEDTGGNGEGIESSLLYHETFVNGLGLIQQAGGATLEHLPEFAVGDRTGAVRITDRVDNHDGFDLPFESLGLELGDEYAVTVHGFVDGEETPESGDQAVVQIPSGDYPVIGGAEFVPGEEFLIEGSGTWTNDDYAAFRIQSSWVEGGRDSEVSFYVTEVLVEKTGEADVPGEPGEEPSDPAEAFTLVDFENQDLGGFEGRNGAEELVITDGENHTPEGQYSLHVSNRQNNWHGPSLDVTPYINTGETYEVSAWVKVDTESAQTITLSTQVGEGSPTYNNIASATLSAEDGWVEITGDYRYTSLGGGFVSIYLESSNVNLDFYIDDVNFSQIDSDPIDVDLELAPLKDVYADHFSVGNIVSSQDLESPRVDLLNHHHNLVTAENAMKPGEVYDGREFDFSGVNTLVEKVHAENLDLHGHVLVWHSQSPDWHHTENGTPLSREEALENMRIHIKTVMENFGELRSWDVVNEALDGSWQNPEDWQGNLRNTGWLRAIGEDYIYEAFSYARQVADENGWHDMVLYYNDYNDHVQGKARTMYHMIKDINERYASENPDDSRKLVSGVGMQGHYNIDINPENVKLSIERFEQLGIDIGITELDVTTNTPNQVVESELIRQGQVYARLFQIFREHSASIDRVTLWGLNDSNSWRSDRFPLLFDGTLSAKPAYYAVIDPDGFLEEYPLEEAEANQGYAVYGTPEINAEVDSIWDDAPVFNMNRMQQAHEILASGTSRALWDEDNLYVLFQVSDSILDVSAAAAHEQDSVEAFVNETGEQTTTYVDGVGQYRVNYENAASFNPEDYSEGFQSAARLTGSGYVVEMAIPWKNVTPEVGHTLGFDVQINDAREGERHGVAAWNDTTGQGWQDPSVYGNLTLVNTMNEEEEEPEEPEQPEKPGKPDKSHPVHPEHPGNSDKSHPVHPEHPGKSERTHPVHDTHPGRGKGVNNSNKGNGNR